MIICKFENGGKASLRHVTVDVLVLKNDKILLVKRAPKLIEGGKWGTVGGYMERDETLHQGVKREVMEETGWQVKDINLLRIRDEPDVPGEDRQNISFVYTCVADKKIGKPDHESDTQEWFDLSKVPAAQEMAFDHLDNIELYLSGLK